MRGEPALFRPLPAARWAPDAKTEVLAQVMTGETAMGVAVGRLEPADIGFAAGYVLVSRSTAHGVATARLDQFSVSDRTFKALDNNAEHGWAATGAWSRPLSERSEIVVEGVFTHSTRPDRSRFGLSPTQESLQGRTAFRMNF